MRAFGTVGATLFLLVISCALPGGLLATIAAQAQSASGPLDQIEALASGSKCASYPWKNRGIAPRAYIQGVALVFARAVCQSARPDVLVVSSATGAPGGGGDKSDALAWYDAIFSHSNMDNQGSGIETLRHAYTLLIGLGMRESSGKYCSGRDRSANFSTADSAEAGTFQTSWGAAKTNDTLPGLFQKYASDQSGCLLDVFSKRVTCGAWDAKNWGAETEVGFKWQKLTKSCPAFATEYAAVVLRSHGGKTGEFGPIRQHAAEVRPECDDMLLKIQQLVQANSAICSAL